MPIEPRPLRNLHGDTYYLHVSTGPGTEKSHLLKGNTSWFTLRNRRFAIFVDWPDLVDIRFLLRCLDPKRSKIPAGCPPLSFLLLLGPDHIGKSSSLCSSASHFLEGDTTRGPTQETPLRGSAERSSSPLRRASEGCPSAGPHSATASTHLPPQLPTRVCWLCARLLFFYGWTLGGFWPAD